METNDSDRSPISVGGVPRTIVTKPDDDEMATSDSSFQQINDSDSGSELQTSLRPLSVLRKRRENPALSGNAHTRKFLDLGKYSDNYNGESDRESNVIDSEDDRASESATEKDKSRVGKKEKRPRPTHYSHTFLVHTSIRASPLSKESPEQNYRGFYNLAMLLLFVLNVRLIIENWLKYGLLIRLPGKGIKLIELSWALLSFSVLPICIAAAFSIELLASTFEGTNIPTPISILIIFFQIITISITIGIPTWISWYKISHPAVSAAPLFCATILFLKLISYVLVNADLRAESREKVAPKQWEDKSSREAKLPKLRYSSSVPIKDGELKYPQNITMKNLVYFSLVPTLSYQISYPRTERFRKTFFSKRLLEFFIAMLGMYFLGAQYAAPTLLNSIGAMEDLNIAKVFERLLKLSVVSVLMWLLMFYAFFHSFMNLMAEILLFGDRRFYQNWWNAPDIASYWRLWNLPVYNWGKRHIYLPLIINHRVPPWIATLVVFTISAILHELLIGVPVHCLSGWAFWGMMGQLPLIILTKLWDSVRSKLFGKNKEFFDNVGNIVFWISFTIVGQPMCILLYYFKYYKDHASDD